MDHHFKIKTSSETKSNFSDKDNNIACDINSSNNELPQSSCQNNLTEQMNNLDKLTNNVSNNLQNQIKISNQAMNVQAENDNNIPIDQSDQQVNNQHVPGPNQLKNPILNRLLDL